MRDSEWELSNTQGAAGDVRPISSYGKRKGTLQALLLILLSFSKSSDKAAVFCFVVAVFFFSPRPLRIVSQFFWMDYIRQGWKSTCSYYYREVARNKQERVACLICARFLNSSPFDPHKGSKKTSVTIEEAETAPQVSGHWLNPSLVFFASERLQIRLGKRGDILKGGAT